MRIKGLSGMGHHLCLCTVESPHHDPWLCEKNGEATPAPELVFFFFSFYLGKGDEWPSCQSFSREKPSVQLWIWRDIFMVQLKEPKAPSQMEAGKRGLEGGGLAQTSLEGFFTLCSRTDFWFLSFLPYPYGFPIIFGLRKVYCICDKTNALHC